MPIPVTKDDAPDPGEHCCFCYRLTRFWYEPKDVAVCQSCADTHEPSEVPTKAIWCDAVVEKFPHLRGGLWF